MWLTVRWLGLFILCLGACGPQKGDSEDSGDLSSTDDAGSGDTSDATTVTPTTNTPTTDTPTTGDTPDEPPMGACGEPQPEVRGFDLRLTIAPEPGPDNPPTFVEADCTVDALLATDVQDGLALRCPQDGGEVLLTVEYVASNLPLPASVTVGLAVHVRYSTYDAETSQRSILVQALDDARVVLAAHEGPGLLPFVEGMGVLAEFWGPLAITDLPSGCPAIAGSCESEVQRGGLGFVVGDSALELFDHQTGQLGPLGIHVADVIHALSGDNMCDGGTDTQQNFLVVHD